MILGVPRETYPGEFRVAATPGVAQGYGKTGVELIVESGAGQNAGFSDEQYVEKGAKIASSRSDLFAKADVIAQVRTFGANAVEGRVDLDLLRAGQALVGFADPLGALDRTEELARRGVVLLATELVPRITRAQNMDALSSMATIAGYKASLLAAMHLPKMFPLMMTAAGTMKPAGVLVLGAGVAGLQAIATCRRLGAVVRAYDVRSAVKEQVESLGAKFLEMDLPAEEAEDKGGYAKALGEEFYAKQREMMLAAVEENDVVITTAAVPGKKAPILVTAEMVGRMRRGSVVVDLAAERGGNCELTRPDETVVQKGVTIVGPTNLPATVPHHASQMYARNIANLVALMVDDDGALDLGTDDEVITGCLVSKDGAIVHPMVREAIDATRGAAERGRTD
ncbi:MAG: Re/Si-specific NAD(P)(+) transhydrogenase subunit alpha [Acidobacteriota bacterium]|nr:Re/Si-specific NAD(P)(+) transhydrogenase subunit alpha [Acidobacteriota bacterium]